MTRLAGILLTAVVTMAALAPTPPRTGLEPQVIQASAHFSETPLARASRFGRFTDPMDIDGAVE